MGTTMRKRSAKKELILQKASAMFRERGYTTTSMRDLADAVGIEAASLYNHIHSKAEILQDIIFRTASRCNEHMDSLEQGGQSDLEKVESLIRFHVRMMLDHFDDYCVMINEWIHLPEPWLSDFTGQRRSYAQKMEGIIQHGIDAGAMKPVLPYIAVLTILSSVRGLEFWHRSAKKITPQVIEDNLVMHLIHGLKN